LTGSEDLSRREGREESKIENYHTPFFYRNRSLRTTKTVLRNEKKGTPFQEKEFPRGQDARTAKQENRHVQIAPSVTRHQTKQHHGVV